MNTTAALPAATTAPAALRAFVAGGAPSAMAGAGAVLLVHSFVRTRAHA